MRCFGQAVKNIVLMAALFTVIACTGCVNKSPLKIADDAGAVLSGAEIQHCYLLELAPYDRIQVESLDISISDEQVLNFANQIVEQHTEKKTITDREIVEVGDYVLCNYEIRRDNKVLSTIYGCVIHVGEGDFDKDFEESLVGAPVGEKIQINWIVPDIPAAYGDYPELVGCEVPVNVFIREIYTLVQYNLNDDFAQKFYKIQTVEEFLASVRDQLREQAEEKSIAKKKEAMIGQLIEKSSFSINEDEIANFAVKFYTRYKSNAIAAGTDVLTYAQQAGIAEDEDGLMERCYLDAELQVKRFLVLGRIAYMEKLTPTEKEIEQYCLDQGGNMDELTEAELAEVSYLISQEKAIDYVYDRLN